MLKKWGSPYFLQKSPFWWNIALQCASDACFVNVFVFICIIPHICHFFTQAKFLENKIYTEKTRKLRQNTQKIANFLRYYGKIHSKLPIFRVKSVKIYTGQKKFTREFSWLSWQISGMMKQSVANKAVTNCWTLEILTQTLLFKPNFYHTDVHSLSCLCLFAIT